MDEYLIHLDNFQLLQKDFLIRLLVAVGIGFLIGFEREFSASSNKEQSFAGIRTFVILVLLGFIAPFAGFLFSQWVYIGILLSVITLVGISYWISSSKGDIGGTTEFTALVAFFLGSLTFMGYIAMSLTLTVIVVVMLSAKLSFRSMVLKITRSEMYDIVRFVVVALLVFPFLPDRNFGPYNVINPREIGWVVILTSGIGFLGYLLMKFLGAGRGILFSGIIGGLISSTLVTWVFARKSRETPSLSPYCATAILAGCTVMVIRVFVLLWIFNKPMTMALAVPLGMILLAAGGSTWYFYWKQTKRKDHVTEFPTGKPLNLTSALWFGLFFTAVILVISYTNDVFGKEGIYLSSGIAGLTDIDAVAISVSKLGGVQIPFHNAQTAIILATLSNTVAKSVISIWAGHSELRKKLIFGYGAILIACVAALLYHSL